VAKKRRARRGAVAVPKIRMRQHLAIAAATVVGGFVLGPVGAVVGGVVTSVLLTGRRI
jgi:hypothetical protein